MRFTTPKVVSGLSSVACLKIDSDFCCPPVVGMAKGTGDLPQYKMRRVIPTRNMTAPAYGNTTPNRRDNPALDPAHATAHTARTANKELSILHLSTVG